MDPLIGQIVLFAFPRIPDGYLPCDGSLLQIAQFAPLYSVIGTTYGGDGRSNFALPDLRGRIPIHRTSATGPTPHPLGSSGGSEQVVLTGDQIAVHGHAISAASAVPPVGPAPGPSASVIFAAAGTGTALTPYAMSLAGATPVTLAGVSIEPSGPPAQPHDNMMPTLFMTYCIAYEGVLPA